MGTVEVVDAADEADEEDVVTLLLLPLLLFLSTILALDIGCLLGGGCWSLWPVTTSGIGARFGEEPPTPG